VKVVLEFTSMVVVAENPRRTKVLGKVLELLLRIVPSRWIVWPTCGVGVGGLGVAVGITMEVAVGETPSPDVGVVLPEVAVALPLEEVGLEPVAIRLVDASVMIWRPGAVLAAITALVPPIRQAPMIASPTLL
jgi:hypothetical protein